VITGFNTDIEHDGVIYHVQTEDKGVETPLILSLVYNRGTILASKRSPYDDLVKNGFDEKVLVERLQKQHKLICAAVRAGRIEELKQMTAKAAAVSREVKANGNGSAASPIPKPTELIGSAENGHAAPSQFLKKPEKAGKTATTQELNPAVTRIARDNFAPAIPPPKEELIWDLPLQIVEEELIVEVGNVIDEPLIAADAVEIITELNQAAKLKPAHLAIEFLNETTFKAGERKTLNIRVFRGQSSNFIAAAQVMVKVLGSSFRPLIFHAKTDASGLAVVHLQLPQFRSGRGAILVRAIHSGEEAELRQIIRQS
jgi:hypothetical protein